MGRNRNSIRPGQGPTGVGGLARAKGQALVLFAVFAAVLAIGVVLLFDTGQATQKKVRLTNAADAAAYSMAVQQARVLNTAAILNRARVANEVTIAQAVSLWSAANMWHSHTVYGNAIAHQGIGMTGICLGTYYNPPSVPPAPIWGQICAGLLSVLTPLWNVSKNVIHPIYAQAEEVMAGAREILHPVLEIAIPALSLLNEGYALASEGLFLALTVDGNRIAKDVIERIDPDAGINLVGETMLHTQMYWANHEFLEKHSPEDGRNPGMDRFRNVVMNARDKFSAQRQFGGDILGGVIHLGWTGGTDMMDDYRRWAGIDTMAVGVNLGLFELNMTLGLGGAQAGQGEADFDLVHSSGEERQDPGFYSDDHPGHYEPYGGAYYVDKAGQHPSLNGDPDWLWKNCRGHNQANLKWTCFTVGGHGNALPSGNLTSRSDAFLNNYRGLQAYRDVNLDYARSPQGENAGPRFTVYVVSGREHARTSEDLDNIAAPQGGEIRLEAGVNQFSAVASAQPYFSRPASLFPRHLPRSWSGDPGVDTYLEVGNTFSPYWEARLIETPASDLTVIAAAEY